jgi:hypothetical protein
MYKCPRKQFPYRYRIIGKNNVKVASVYSKGATQGALHLSGE